MGLWYAIISKISKVPTDPMSAKKFIQGQRSQISFFFCIFLVNGKCYYKNSLDKVVDHAIVYKNCCNTFFLRITIPEISPFQKSKIAFYMICTHFRTTCEVVYSARFFNVVSPVGILHDLW